MLLADVRSTKDLIQSIDFLRGISPCHHGGSRREMCMRNGKPECGGNLLREMKTITKRKKGLHVTKLNLTSLLSDVRLTFPRVATAFLSSCRKVKSEITARGDQGLTLYSVSQANWMLESCKTYFVRENLIKTAAKLHQSMRDQLSIQELFWGASFRLTLTTWLRIAERISIHSTWSRYEAKRKRAHCVLQNMTSSLITVEHNSFRELCWFRPE